jgi:hypothetical protein
MAGQTRIGRPIKPAEAGTRVPLGLRVTADTKARVDQEARDSGRTQSQEAERLIELAFQYLAAFGDFQAWKAKHSADMQKLEHDNACAVLHRLGWQRIPTNRGDVYAPPGVAPFPASGFVDPDTEEGNAAEASVSETGEARWSATPREVEEAVERGALRALEQVGLKRTAS